MLWGMTFLEFIIALTIAILVAGVLWKYFKWAIETVVFFAVLLLALYIVVRILEFQGVIIF